MRFLLLLLILVVTAVTAQPPDNNGCNPWHGNSNCSYTNNCPGCVALIVIFSFFGFWLLIWCLCAISMDDTWWNWGYYPQQYYRQPYRGQYQPVAVEQKQPPRLPIASAPVDVRVA